MREQAFLSHRCDGGEFFSKHIVLELTFLLNLQRRKNQHQPVIEQVGSYDPLINQHNERLISLNFERIRYWIGNGAHISTPVGELLGIAGFLPIHPKTYMTAWRNREAAAKKASEEAVQKGEVQN